MDQKQQTPLQQAAEDYSDGNPLIGEHFEAGANWQRNHVWHAASEIPDEDKVRMLWFCIF